MGELPRGRAHAFALECLGARCEQAVGEAAPACGVEAVVGEDALDGLFESRLHRGEHRSVELGRFGVTEQPREIIVVPDAAEQRFQLVGRPVGEQVCEKRVHAGASERERVDVEVRDHRKRAVHAALRLHGCSLCDCRDQLAVVAGDAFRIEIAEEPLVGSVDPAASDGKADEGEVRA